MMIVLSLISACETPTATDGCAAFDFIYPSRTDTVETLRQVAIHNDTYKTVCDLPGWDE